MSLRAEIFIEETPIGEGRSAIDVRSVVHDRRATERERELSKKLAAAMKAECEREGCQVVGSQILELKR